MANTAQLTATVQDSGGSVIPGASTYWTSEDTSIATVDQSGLVTAAAIGSTIIHAISGQASATKTVTVTSAAVPPNPTLGEIDPITAVQGGTALSITVLGIDIPSDATLVFSASGVTVDDSVIAGDGTGITGHITVADDADVGAGTVKIHSDTTGDSGTLAFAVTAMPQTLDHLTMVPSSSTVVETDTAPTLTNGQWQTSDESSAYTDTLSPADAFSSSDTSVATIGATDYVIVIQGPGTTTITRTAGGLTVSFTLTVTAAAALFPNLSSFSGAPGDTFDLTPILDQDGTDVTADCVCTINDTSIATMDAPTITSMTPAIIKQNDSGISFAFVGTNFRAGMTLEGLPTGVTADAALTISDDTHCSVALSATGTATLGNANLHLSVAGHGDSNVKVLAVNVQYASVPRTQLVFKATAIGAWPHPAAALGDQLPLTHNTGTLGWKQFGTSGVSGGVTPLVQTTQGAVTQSATLGGWVSMLLTGGTGSVPSGTYTFKMPLWAQSGSAYKLTPVVYIYRPSDASIVATLLDSAPASRGMTTGSSSAVASTSPTVSGRVFTFSVATAINVLPDDILVVELYAVGPSNDFVQIAYGGTTTVTEGGTADSGNAFSVLVFPSAINFQS